MPRFHSYAAYAFGMTTYSYSLTWMVFAKPPQKGVSLAKGKKHLDKLAQFSTSNHPEKAMTPGSPVLVGPRAITYSHAITTACSIQQLTSSNLHLSRVIINYMSIVQWWQYLDPFRVLRDMGGSTPWVDLVYPGNLAAMALRLWSQLDCPSQSTWRVPMIDKIELSTLTNILLDVYIYNMFVFIVRI